MCSNVQKNPEEKRNERKQLKCERAMRAKGNKKKEQNPNVCQRTSSAENNSIKCGDTQASTFL